MKAIEVRKLLTHGYTTFRNIQELSSSAREGAGEARLAGDEAMSCIIIIF